jgi:hypothetical protein
MGQSRAFSILPKHIGGSFASLSRLYRHNFKLFPLVAQIQCSLVSLKIHNALPKGLKSPLMRIAYRLQVLDGLLEHIASAFQSLDLIFEAFDQGYFIICAFGEPCIPSAKC